MAFKVPLFVLIIVCITSGFCHAGKTSSYTRSTDALTDMPAEAFPSLKGSNAPEQVHITQGDRGGRGVIISWVMPDERQPNVVRYWKAYDPSDIHKAHSQIFTYRYYNYSSGYIHHATIKKLEYDTKYFYELGSGDAVRQFSFTTPPRPGPDVPYTFGIMGCDLGQTYASNSTVGHYMANPKGQAVLFVGDLSYADNFPMHDQRKWDSWGRFVEKSTAYQPWIWTAGNHELDFDPEIGEYMLFKPYYIYIAFMSLVDKVEAHLLFGTLSREDQLISLSFLLTQLLRNIRRNTLGSKEFTKVDRHETPWLIVMMHAPLYNSDNYHYMEGESMRVIFEPWFVQYKVGLVLAGGHVHAYERSERISNIRYNITDGLSTPIKDQSAPVYLTMGDGENIEGLANNFIDPQPFYSAYREASFGHGLLEIKNRTHAYYTWHRNQDDEAVASDSTWFYNRFWYPKDESA